MPDTNPSLSRRCSSRPRLLQNSWSMMSGSSCGSPSNAARHLSTSPSSVRLYAFKSTLYVSLPSRNTKSNMKSGLRWAAPGAKAPAPEPSPSSRTLFVPSTVTRWAYELCSVRTNSFSECIAA